MSSRPTASSWRPHDPIGAVHPRPVFTAQNSFQHIPVVLQSASDIHLPSSAPEMIMGSVNPHEPDAMDLPLRNPIPPSPPKLSPCRLSALIFFMLAGLLFSVIDTTIVSTALVTIAIHMDNFKDMYWVVLAYMLSYLGCAIGFAKLSDHFGRLPIFIASWVIFSAFSIGCGWARTMAQLILFRALQGVGGSGLYSLSQISLAEVAPHGKNGMIGSLIGCTLSISFVLGPVLGGAISVGNWHWIFIMNIPAGVICSAGLVMLWPKGFGQARHPWREFWRIDFIGNIFILAACVLMIFSLQEAGTQTFAWTSVAFLVTFIMSLVCWALFWGWQMVLRHLPMEIEPVFPLRLIQHRIYMAAVGAMFLSGFSYLAVIITLPERFQIVNGDTSLAAGLHLLPMLGATALGSVIGGVVSKKNNYTSQALIIAAGLQVVGLGLLTTFDASSSPMDAQFAYQGVFGLGVGLTFSSATILTKIHAAGKDHAVAQGTMAQVRVLGGALGLVVCTIIFNIYVDRLEGILSVHDMDALHRSPLAAIDMDPANKVEIQDMFSSSFNNMVWVMLYVSIAGFVTSLFTWENNPTPLDAIDEAARGNGGAPGSNHKQIGSRGSDTELEDLAIIRSPMWNGMGRPDTPSPRTMPPDHRGR